MWSSGLIKNQISFPMKKHTIASFMLGAFCLTASAHKTVEGSLFFDNWSVGLNVGGVTTLNPDYPFWKSTRAMTGVEVTKMITPIFGLTSEAAFSFNSCKNYNTVGHNAVNLLGRFNLMNAFGGYTGTPRFFEVEAVAGVGWLHAFMGHQDGESSLTSKFGLQFNLNLPKGWSVGIKPAVQFDMTGNVSAFATESGNFHRSPAFDADNASFELSAGVTYHFKNSNGTHSFVNARLYNQSEIDRLNARINDLRQQIGDRDQKLKESARRQRDLQNKLNESRNQHPIPKE